MTPSFAEYKSQLIFADLGQVLLEKRQNLLLVGNLFPQVKKPQIYVHLRLYAWKDF